jgi:ATP-dependent RNA helicase DDX41
MDSSMGDDVEIPEEDDYEEYVPLKVRRAIEAAKRSGKPFSAPSSGAAGGVHSAASTGVENADTHQNSSSTSSSMLVHRQFIPGQSDDNSFQVNTLGEKKKESEQNVSLMSEEVKKQLAMEQDLMSQVSRIQGVSFPVYSSPLQSDWRPFEKYLSMSKEKKDHLRKKYHILVSGDEESFFVAPPITSFEEMRLPPFILEALNEKNILKPTPIQAQSIPIALSGRDLIGIAFTGSGKTLVFILPCVLFSLQEEMRMPLIKNEGPIAIILSPSRELAKQTYELICHLIQNISSTRDGTNKPYPKLSVMLAIGGESSKAQLEQAKRMSASGGIHMIIATPGRMIDLLEKKLVSLHLCKVFVLDEGDRMLDIQGFEKEIKQIRSYFQHQYQTIIFSATMPKTIQEYAKNALVKPMVVNIGRAGASNLNIRQEFELVKREQRLVAILHVLQKTAPPVLIFAENKSDVDEINEYLLLKGVRAVSIHGGKTQQERFEAMKLFKEGNMDVLIATDIAAKGIDFPLIQHVINFDMPKEIENYVHRIGRTGRAGHFGISSTLLHVGVDPTSLLDLKHLLLEAKQEVPQFILALTQDLASTEAASVQQTGTDASGAGCAYCGGLGHRITDCPKLEHQRRQMQGSRRDNVNRTVGDW